MPDHLFVARFPNLSKIECHSESPTCSLPFTEYRHLRGRADLRIVRANWQEANGIAESVSDAQRPGLELGASPLEAVIAVTERASRHRLELHVVLDVGRRHNHRWRARKLEQHALKGCQPGRVKMLDHFHDGSSIVAFNALVTIG